ncbi:MAG: hypothetical protein FJ137_22515 [Deltaproteobacteria bacterium]|nr:hypothetical protein [Deltaproteobacteria bacterium]
MADHQLARQEDEERVRRPALVHDDLAGLDGDDMPALRHLQQHVGGEPTEQRRAGQRLHDAGGDIALEGDVLHRRLRRRVVGAWSARGRLVVSP